MPAGRRGELLGRTVGRFHPVGLAGFAPKRMDELRASVDERQERKGEVAHLLETGSEGVVRRPGI